MEALDDFAIFVQGQNQPVEFGLGPEGLGSLDIWTLQKAEE
jgi:hypothetical protein